MTTIKDFISRFGFNATPFTCELRVQDYFVHEIYTEPLQHLCQAVERRMSAALIAPAGAGKTALLRALVNRLPEARYRVHYVKVTDLSKRDLCREIATAIDAETAGTYPALVRRLQERLAACLVIDGLRPVLLLDEAHDMRPEVLGILRILTNFEMDSHLVVSIILSGQPPLAKQLRHPQLEDVAHRLSHYAQLRLLSRAETVQYVRHRCLIAGVATCPFDTGAIEALFEIGRGNLRATDHLAIKSLEVAHQAEANVVDSNHIAQARAMLWT